jgi:hypothetical protein
MREAPQPSVHSPGKIFHEAITNGAVIGAGMGGFFGLYLGLLTDFLGGWPSPGNALATMLTALFVGALAGAAGLAALFAAIVGVLLAINCLWQACTGREEHHDRRTLHELSESSVSECASLVSRKATDFDPGPIVRPLLKRQSGPAPDVSDIFREWVTTGAAIGAVLGGLIGLVVGLVLSSVAAILIGLVIGAAALAMFFLAMAGVWLALDQIFSWMTGTSD